MPAERYFTEEDLGEGASVTLEGPEHHHLVHVMRAREGSRVELVNGRGALAEALVQSTGKRSAELLVEASTQHAPPDRQLTLIQAVPRRPRLDTILEKCTELGVTAFWLFPGERGERKPKQVERLRAVTVAAMKQCGRLHLPEIELLDPIGKWSDLPQPTFFGDFSPDVPPLQPAQNAAIVIGPESGLSEKEIAALRSLGATGVSLHTNILRTDTAAICALAILSQ